jgi:hypothetical protein
MQTLCEIGCVMQTILSAKMGVGLHWVGSRDSLLFGRPGLSSSQAKNITILDLPCLPPGLHIVCPKDSQRYYLLFTRIHNLFAPLFTSIRTLLKNLNRPSPP